MKILLFSYLLLCSLSFSTAKCINSEKSLLLQLRNSLTWDYNRSSEHWNVYLRGSSFPREYKLGSWNQSSDCCSWFGVSCNKAGFVIQLDLSNEDITSALENSAALFDLQHLTILDLSHNFFNSTLPSRIGNLTHLVELNLESAGFFGQIPVDVVHLRNLVTLSLPGNSFATPIPSFNLSTKLSSLDLAFNSFTGKVPSYLFSLPSLKTILLSNNQFSGEIPESESVPVSMLETLDLSQNNLEGPLPKSMFELENLTTIDLSYNKFNGTIHLQIFRRFRNLEYLDLSYNSWSINANSSDFLFLSFFPVFRTLKLASCNLTTFPRLTNLTELMDLELSNNHISGEIPNWIWNVGFLKSLNLSHNQLVSIQEPYALSDSLESLDLHYNRISGNIPILPPQLDYLDLSSNRFTSIPLDIFNRLRLQRIDFVSLSNNSLSGVLPESFCNETNHGILDLSENNFSGKIPTCIAQVYGVSVLKALVLRNNNFSGPIPNEFPSNSPLKVLDLNRNSLEGEIPKSLLNCSQLEVLDLGHNDLSGKFPCLLSNLSTLQVLILRSNKFDGEIECPSSADESWSVLQILDLAHNDFSGELPRALLTKFQGMVAEEKGAQLKVLGFIVYDNRYVYHYYIDYPDIYYRYTVTVTIKGQEMKVPKILTIFTSIDFSSNNFSGAIPSEFGELQSLFTLNLSRNALTGEIPSSIGKMRGLESLDVSWNDLSGTIPASLGQLNFLQFLNLSFNRLTGRIPKGGQIETFPEDFFIGNEGLCGFPLKENCSDEESPKPGEEGHENSGSNEIDWSFLSAEIGFIVGFGVFIGPIVFSRVWRKRYFERVDDIIVRIFPTAISKKWILWTAH